MTTALQNGSAVLAGAAANNTVTLPSGQPGPAHFGVTSVNSCGGAIFNVQASDIFANPLVQQIELDPGTAQVINVSGTTANWNNGNMVSQFTSTTWQGHTLWNFYQGREGECLAFQPAPAPALSPWSLAVALATLIALAWIARRRANR